MCQVREDVKIPTYKPHTNHKRSSVRSHTLAPTTIYDFSHSLCWSPLIDLGHINSVTYFCHPLWFVCGQGKGILTSPLTLGGVKGVWMGHWLLGGRGGYKYVLSGYVLLECNLTGLVINSCSDTHPIRPARRLKVVPALTSHQRIHTPGHPALRLKVVPAHRRPNGHIST